MDTICLNRINEIRKQIEKQLFLGTEDAFQALLQLTQTREYRILSECDNALLLLGKCMEIWQREESYQEITVLQRAGRGNPLCIKGINEQYNLISFMLYRIESELPEAVINRTLEELVQSDTSAEMIKYIADQELERTKEVLLKISAFFLESGQLLRAGRILLYLREEGYDAEVLLMLANVFLENQNYTEAFNILAEIRNPDETVREMKVYLQKYIG